MVVIELISKISFEPCKIPNEKIKINPKIISSFPETIEDIHNPKKLNTIDKL
ncbi:hypothetical protein GCM10022257_25040 [Hyunsoonleella aestuarii]|uniref:Uncharacterized protein n=1 Tax=Hyunsoonleella aestuarii TaxID=912802 RepID=A0ABP8EDT6_9FLAO